MKIVEQSVTLLNMTLNPIMLLEQCGRVCYKSEAKTVCDGMNCGKSFNGQGTWYCSACRKRASEFVQRLIKRGHESVLEHASATFLFVTDRGISHELVRHRLCAYSQESTRYCDYGNKNGEVTFVAPYKKALRVSTGAWQHVCKTAEEQYLEMRKLKVELQWARSVLPTCLKTEIVTTTNFRQWRHILRTRALNPRAHPQIRDLMRLTLDVFMREVPVVFQDINDVWEQEDEEQHA